MKKKIFLIFATIFSLTSCGDIVDNIEVTTLSTIKIINDKAVAEKEPLSDIEGESRSDVADDIETTSFDSIEVAKTTVQNTTSSSENLEVDNGVLESIEPENFTLDASQGDVDIDLAQLNKNMVYSQLYNMIMNPKDYLGKRIRIEGSYVSDSSSEAGLTYHFIVITDEAACCQQGMEIKLDEGLAYPSESANVTITGVFQSYDEGDQTWYYLQGSKLE